MYVQSQLPYAFVQLVAIVVYVFALQACVVAAGIIANAKKNQNTSQMVSGYLTLVLMIFVFLSIVSIYNLLSDPTGDDAADFPVTM